jgi:hypothetical protein
MINGFEFELTDGQIIQVVPAKGAKSCSIVRGDTTIEIEPSIGTFKVVARQGKLLSEVPHVVRFEPKELLVTRSVEETVGTNEFHPLKACATCNGQICCVTGGCVNCGCGWVCNGGIDP